MAIMVRIIGIDPGLRRTGWGVIESDGVRLKFVASGVIKPETDCDLSLRLLDIYQGLSSILSGFKPDEAAVEKTFVNRDATATLKLGQARGIALLAPAKAGIRVAEYAPNLVKKTVTGSGHGEKGQIHAMLGYLLPKAKPKNDDEADALAIAITHAHHRHINEKIIQQSVL